jgi:PKD repeat protein
MKNLTRNSCIVFLLFFLSFFSHSQEWVKMMQDPNVNFYDTQAAFNEYWKDRKVEKGKGYKQFRRWEAYMAPRVYPSGDVKLPTQTYGNYQKWVEENFFKGSGDSGGKNSTSDGQKSLAGDWQPMGPIGKPAGGGAGRINFIRFDPAASTTMYVGAPDGGLWKTTNGGTSWSTNTDQLAVIGCSDIAIANDNSNLLYLATGDSNGGDTYSIGVLKSTDGGATWNSTGLTFNVSSGVTLGRLLIDPTNSNIVTAFGSNGIWRTTNGGTSWSQPTGTFNGIKDAEYKPGSTTVMYAAGTIFKRSTDGGLNWTTVATGLSNIQRLAIAVTPANADYVYILATRTTDNGFNAVIRSTNSGAAFSTRMTAGASNNIMGWDNGADAGGQGWYDVAIAASPTNAEEIYTGGVNMWKSTNGGTSFVLNSHWYGGYSKPYVHADIHDIVFLPGSGTTVFSGNDGGVFKTTNSGSEWSDISSNLSIAQQYRIGLSALNATILVAGHQDNGTNKYTSGAWSQIYGGDGMDCFIDRTNNNIVYASYVYGEYLKSTDGGNNFSAITSGIPFGTTSQEWLSSWHQDPVTANTLYAGGRTALYRSINGGSTWASRGTPTGSGNVIDFDIAPSNNTIIYAIKVGTNAVSKSTNSGTSWTPISTGLPTSVAPTCIKVSNTDANVVFVSYSGYGAANKVFKSIDGGSTWTNISAGLPNIPVNTIVYENGSANDAIYIGTDVGVYYKDNTTAWIEFNFNLPNVAVRDLEIYYPTNRLRAATYGRGTWDSDLYTDVPAAPTADFSASSTTICATNSVTFTNASSGIPDTYSWSFVGGTPSTSTATNPVVTYANPGVYQVSLTATNAFGSDEEIKVGYITVLDNIGASLPYSEGFSLATFPPAGWNLINSDLGTTWVRSATVGIAPTASNSMIFDNYNIDDRGNQDEMRVPRLSLSGLSSAQLTFDVAYAPYDAANFDGLEVLISTDCQQTFTSLYSKSNTTLATAAATTSPFAPSAAQWRTETINLTSYVGQTNVVIAFRNLAGYGNNLYVDNINLTGAAALDANFSASSTNVCVGQTVTYTNTSTGSISSYSWDFGANASPATATGAGPHNVTYSGSGQKTVSLSVNSGANVETKTNYISVNSIPTITGTTPNSICGTGTVVLGAASSAGTINWYAASTGGPSLGTGTSFTTPSISSTTTYYVDATNGSCTTGTRTAITATINSTPTITGTTPNSIAAPGAITISATPSNGAILWFTSSTGGAAIIDDLDYDLVGNSLTVTNLLSTTIFYAQVQNGFCVNSMRTAVTATVNSPISNTQVISYQCNMFLSDNSIDIYCEGVTGASIYEFKLVNGATSLTIQKPSRTFKFSQVNGVLPGLTYQVSVRTYVGSSWSNYGAACPITAYNSTSTKLIASQCGINLSNVSTDLYADAVVGATQYKFRITNGASVQEITRTSRTFKMSQLPIVHYGAVVTVEVNVFVNGTWIGYGAPCDITMPALPATKLQTSQCGITLTSTATLLYADAISGATQYRFRVKNATIPFADSIVKASRVFRMSEIPGLAVNTTYQVDVAVNINGAWQVYGASCNVTTPAALSMIIQENLLSEHPTSELNDTKEVELIEEEHVISEAINSELIFVQLSAYPNPSNGEFTISSSHEGIFNIINELGKVVQTVELKKSNNFTMHFGHDKQLTPIHPGIYFITGTINGNVVTNKIIVQ